MTRITISAILVATIMVAGIFAFMPVQQASTVHTTITDILGTAGGADLATDLDDAQNQLAAFHEIGDCEQVAGGASPDEICITGVGFGLAVVSVETTTDGGTSAGLGIDLGGNLVCTEQTIVIADSPYTCAFVVRPGQVISLLDAANDDGAGFATVFLITNQNDPT